MVLGGRGRGKVDGDILGWVHGRWLPEVAEEILVGVRSVKQGPILSFV